MKERGMIFNGEMVRAILDGRKTQTRRPVNPQPELTAGSGFSWKGWLYGSGSSDRETNKNFAHVACPFGKPGVASGCGRHGQRLELGRRT